MAQREANKLRHELDSVAGRRGPCFPRELKARTARWIAERRAAGATVAEVASELGLAAGTVTRWSAEARSKQFRALVPVEVVLDRVAAGTVSVVSPSGFRIEGLSLPDAITVLKALG